MINLGFQINGTSVRVVGIYSKIRARDETEGMHCTTVSWDASSLHALQNGSIFDSWSSKLCFLTRSLKTVSGIGTNITCSSALRAVFSAPWLQPLPAAPHRAAPSCNQKRYPALQGAPGILCRKHCPGGSHTKRAVKSFYLFELLSGSVVLGKEGCEGGSTERSYTGLSCSIRRASLTPLSKSLQLETLQQHTLNRTNIWFCFVLFAVAFFFRLYLHWSNKRLFVVGYECVCVYSSSGMP